MARWGRGRGASVAVPLDSALFRENSNCPSAARSAGTVGKWGITSFTSIRSAPYAFASNVLKKPVQDQNSPLTVPAVETEQPPPKPKKFFKSRNVDQLPSVPQITYAPPVPAAPLSPESSFGRKETKGSRRARAYNRDSSSPEAPRFRGVDKAVKAAKKASVAKKVETSNEDNQPPNKRYLVRNRNKVINYAEDGSNSPVPEIISSYVPPPVPAIVTTPKAPSPKPSSVVSSPTNNKPGLMSPTSSKEASEERKPPPIVLRISKGTSRIVSTDSNEGFTSPGSDRHSSLDTHNDFGSDHKKSPSVDSICSPKHEGLKITIKCPGLNHESSKRERKKEKKSHRRHHKNSDDEPLKKAISPLPGSDTYDLYKTLASPVQSADKDIKHKHKACDDIEPELAKLDSDNVTQHSNELPPEPKPPEKSGIGRSRRNRPNINYSENDDYLDAFTKGNSSKHVNKLLIETKKESKKNRKKHDVVPPEAMTATENVENYIESQSEKTELLDILSGSSDNVKSESEVHKSKGHKKHKNKHKHINQDASAAETIDNNDSDEQDVPLSALRDVNEELVHPEDNPGEACTNPDPQLISIEPTNSYNNFSEGSEEEALKHSQDDIIFKPPPVVDDIDPLVEDKPSVKLVITKKKGSIFKSKSLVNDNPSQLPARKRRHLYRHEWANDGKGNETPRSEPEQSENTEVRNNNSHVPEELNRVTRYRDPDPTMDDPDAMDSVKPYTSVRCAKEAKEYYTVVKNVKKAHQIQEIGEFQEFNDDVEYLLDSLQDNNPISTRCLSAITLASKCTAPAFRMHLRAHGIVQKFFSALHDATNDQSLGLCTATVMFVLSQDRLNMDLDRESLELMLNLLESDVSHKNALDDCGLTSTQLTKTQERVKELCAEIKNEGKATHLDLENITVGHLAMETLLSLTSKRAGEWFKEELRVLGGVDHIVRTIQDCAARLAGPGVTWDTANVDTLRKADRCMRVLENVTQQNEENQLFLVSGERVTVAGTLTSILCLCIRECRRGASPPARDAFLDAALPALKVLVNLSHSFGVTVSLGANVVGSHISVMEICLIIMNNQGNFVPDNRNFEFNVCALLLLINLIQNNDTNTRQLLTIRIRIDNEDDIMEMRKPALDMIVENFYKREELAKLAEENTDAILDGDEKEKEDKKEEKKKQSQDDIEETVAKLLAKAGAHMEHTMVGAYIALLLGHVAIVSPELAATVRTKVPIYAPLLPTLRKYYSFLSLTASAEAAIVAHVKSTQRIIDFMETSDKEHSQEPAAPVQVSCYSHAPQHYYQDMPQDMSLSNLTYNTSYSSSSSSDRLCSSMEVDNYH